MRPAVVAHCDWSKDAPKRWMAVARRDGAWWRLSAPERVGEAGALGRRLAAEGAAVVGFDFPVGLPRAYGAATGLGGFTEALGAFGRGDWAAFFDVAERPEDISLRRPFYPRRPGGASRAHLEAGLGAAWRDLLRRCDRGAGRADACMMFWTLGGQQVGKAALAGWREVIAPGLADGAGLWPYDGALEALLAERAVTLAETYPADAYGQIGLRPAGRWSKRSQADRRALAVRFETHLGDPARRLAPEPALLDAIRDGFGADASGEDRFDAAAGLLAMIEVVEGRRPEGAPREDAGVLRWEGWILGQRAG